jgi:hypothetical protein
MGINWGRPGGDVGDDGTEGTDDVAHQETHIAPDVPGGKPPGPPETDRHSGLGGRNNAPWLNS